MVEQREMRNHESMRFGYATQAQLSQSLRFRDRVKAKGDFRPSWFVFFFVVFLFGHVKFILLVFLDTNLFISSSADIRDFHPTYTTGGAQKKQRLDWRQDLKRYKDVELMLVPE